MDADYPTQGVNFSRCSTVWDNRDTQQTDVVPWDGLADKEVVQHEAERAGMMVDQYVQHLAELAQDQERPR